MILIDRSKQEQEIILTISELSKIPNAKYVMSLKNDALRSDSTIILPVNVSLAKERYDLFQINTAVFDDLNTGYYVYEIYEFQQADSPVIGSSTPLEAGKLLIKGVTNDEQIIAPAKNDDYIVYE